jgi:hypothetical protein
LDRLLALRKAEQDQFTVNSGENRGLLARMEALSQFTSKSATLRTAYLALLLFITAIEILPVLVKFLMSLGPPTLYDKILKRAEEVDVEAAEAAFQHERTVANRELEVRQNRQSERIDRIASTVAEIDERRLDEWRSQQLRQGTARSGGVGRPRGPRPNSRFTDRLRSYFHRDQAPPRSGREGEYTPWPTEGSHFQEGNTDNEETRRWRY